MTTEPGYSFVLWAIPRFHREGAANGNAPDSSPARLAGRTATYAAQDPIQAAPIEPPESACLHAHR